MSQQPGPAPFDAVADDYDSSFTDTAVGRLHRATVWRHLDAVLEPSSKILELGCGTGEDALRLARRGHRVLATDVSTAMRRVRQHARLMASDRRYARRAAEVLHGELGAYQVQNLRESG